MSRRLALEGVSFPKPTHLGLWLDKYLKSTSKEDKESKRMLVKEVSEGPEPPDYPAFFQRYQRALEEMGAQVRKAHTRGRLVVGLGGEGVLETSLTLHRTYGVPYIPGSALKGLASRYAHLYLEGEAWRRDLAQFRRGEAQEALFGTTDQQGVVVFFDALPLPGEWRLHGDILNPHHPHYYGGEKEPPADWDSPVPVPFLSTTGTFLLALGPAPGVSLEAAGPWLEAAWTILQWALEEEGIGAKTSSGYGRMQLEAGAKGGAGGQEAAERPEVQDLLTHVRSLSYRTMKEFLKRRADLILSLSPEETEAFRRALEARGLLKDPSRIRQDYKKEALLLQILDKLGV